MAEGKSNWRDLLPKASRIALEEIEPLLNRKLLAQAARLFPQQSFNRTRTALLRAAGAHIGKHSLIQGPLRFSGRGNSCDLLWVGDNTLITGPLHVDLGAPVRIGNWVRIGHDVSLLTINHAIGADWFRAGEIEPGPIEIGDGAWLASRVTVLPRVRIGAGAVVAAGAVVTRDVAANTLVAGVPARLIRSLHVDE